METAAISWKHYARNHSQKETEKNRHDILVTK